MQYQSVRNKSPRSYLTQSKNVIIQHNKRGELNITPKEAQVNELMDKLLNSGQPVYNGMLYKQQDAKELQKSVQVNHAQTQKVKTFKKT
jgi:hypothetical protein